jgi:putative ABC transport system permease protein
MNRLLQYLYQFVLQLWRRLLSLLRRGRYEREMEEEMRFHLEMQIEQNRASGMAAEDAHYAARRQFGNQTWLKKASREMWSLNPIETLIQDLRYGVRTLMKSPGFAFVAVLTLALGIGANTAIFSVVNGVLLRPLPYYEPERLVMVWADRPIMQAQTGLPDFPVTVADFVDWRNQNQVFEHMAAMEGWRMNLTDGGEPESVIGLRASASLFPLLGARLAMGRAFLPEEDRAGADRVVVLSHGLWRQRYGADPKIIGQKITLNNEAYTVIGVTAPDFQFPRRGEIPSYRAAASTGGRQGADGVAGAAVRRGIRVADRVRQCRQPVAGARRRTAKRDGDSGSPRRQPLACCAAIAQREPAAGYFRRRGGAVAGAVGR